MTNPTVTGASFSDTVPLSGILRHVMPVIPELPHEMALDYVRQAYIELARRSSIVVARLEQDYQANVHDYPLEPPEGYEVYQVMGIDHPSYRYVDYWAGQNTGLWNTRFDIQDNKSIYFHTAPSVDSVGSLIVYAKVLPTSCCDSIPVSIENPYGRSIADGAIARLLLIPNKSWTNPRLSQEYERRFNIGVMAARNLADTNRKRGPIVPNLVRVV